jgi:anti-sigma-K factor RskA
VAHEEAAAFALDALDQDGAETFRRHLATCPDCEAALEQLRFAAAALAFAVEPPAPGSGLRRRVLDMGAQVIPLPRRRRRRFLAPAMAAAAAVAVVAAAVRPWETSDPHVGFRRYEASGAKGILLVSRSGEAVLVSRSLPPLAAGTVYELWVIAGNRAAPAGLFRRPPATLNRRVRRGAAVAISVEPAGGSSRPTGPLVLRAETT